MKESIARSGVGPQLINYVTVGSVIPTDSRYPYVSRVASIQAGLPMDSVAMQVSRLCSSGLQAIVSTAQNIMLGDSDYGIGGGVEVMSRGGYLLPALRSGARMGDTQAIDMMVAVLTDPFGVGHVGITAENLATKWNTSREEQDAFALESQQRAARAIAEGRFKSQIVPIVLKMRKGEVVFDTDEHVKANTTLEALAKMKLALKKAGRLLGRLHRHQGHLRAATHRRQVRAGHHAHRRQRAPQRSSNGSEHAFGKVDKADGACLRRPFYVGLYFVTGDYVERGIGNCGRSSLENSSYRGDC